MNNNSIRLTQLTFYYPVISDYFISSVDMSCDNLTKIGEYVFLYAFSNIFYGGGGHGYVIRPNLKKKRKKIAPVVCSVVDSVCVSVLHHMPYSSQNINPTRPIYSFTTTKPHQQSIFHHILKKKSQAALHVHKNRKKKKRKKKSITRQLGNVYTCAFAFLGVPLRVAVSFRGVFTLTSCKPVL